MKSNSHLTRHRVTIHDDMISSGHQVIQKAAVSTFPTISADSTIPSNARIDAQIDIRRRIPKANSNTCSTNNNRTSNQTSTDMGNDGKNKRRKRSFEQKLNITSDPSPTTSSLFANIPNNPIDDDPFDSKHETTNAHCRPITDEYHNIFPPESIERTEAVMTTIQATSPLEKIVRANNNAPKSSPISIVEIDGSYKEGGGQILRNAITYAVLLQKSVIIRNVRANRGGGDATCKRPTQMGLNHPHQRRGTAKGGGLRPQHLMGIKLAVDIGDGGGMLLGGEVGSTTVSYVIPGEGSCGSNDMNNSSDDSVGKSASSKNDIDDKCDARASRGTNATPSTRNVENATANENIGNMIKYAADTGTAGSIALLLQAALLPAFVRSIRMLKRHRLHLPSTISSIMPAMPVVELELRGGTNADHAPQMDYVTQIFTPFINSYFQNTVAIGATAAAVPALNGQVTKNEANGCAPNSNATSITPLTIDIQKRGYFPKGGGIVHVQFRPPISSLYSLLDCFNENKIITFPPIKLTKCQPVSKILIQAFHAGKCPSSIPEKMVHGSIQTLKRAYRENATFRNRLMSEFAMMEESSDVRKVDRGGSCGNANLLMSKIVEDAEIKIIHETNCIGSGSGILIVAYPSTTDTINAYSNNGKSITSDRTQYSPSLSYPPMASSALGNRKIPPVQTGVNAARELIDCIASGGCVDRWLQDQLIPFMALADGRSFGKDNCGDNDGNYGSSGDKKSGSIQMSEVMVGELTLHTQTAMKVAEWMTGCKFEVERLDKDARTDEDERSKSQQQQLQQQEGDYGEAGRILGRRIIRCEGIGFNYA